MDRREFLKTSGLMAAAAAAAPAILTSCGSDAIANAFDTDLLIVGGGPAGTAAAIAAGRMGIRTLIVESGNCLGGMATQGLVAPFMTCYDSKGEQMIIKGIFSEIVDRLVENGWAIHPSLVRNQTPWSAWMKAGHDHVTPFEAEGLKYVLDVMTAEAGVKVLYHASFVKPIMKGKRIAGATLLTKAGLQNVTAKMVIDATGDGDVAFRCGVPCEVGNPATGKIQPASLFFHICNVDSDALIADVEKHLPEFRRVNNVSYRALHWNVAEAEANGEWDLARKSVNIFKSVQHDEWAVNCTRVLNVNPLDSESLTAGEIEGRRQVQEIMHFFRKYVVGCKNVKLKSSASTLGIRESRHALGEHILRGEDLLNGVVPDDSILVASNSLDVHGGGNGANTSVYTTINALWYGVPYRSLVPQGVENLLLAGRNLSAESDAAGAVRVMPPAMAMGHAAGVAAAIAIKGGTAPRNIDSDELRRTLLNQGAFLG